MRLNLWVLLLCGVSLTGALPGSRPNVADRWPRQAGNWWEEFVEEDTGPPENSTPLTHVQQGNTNPDIKPIHTEPATSEIHEKPKKEQPGTRTGTGGGQSCGGLARHECVPYYQCRDNNTIITDGEGLVDIRGSIHLDERCSLSLEVCCRYDGVDTSQGGTHLPHDDGQYQACGQRNEVGVDVRITGLGATETQFGEFPWMVAVLRTELLSAGREVKLYICGGSLIAPNLVLTAAHCVSQYGENSKLVVRAGEWDTQHAYEIYPHFDGTVQKVTLHPDFNNKNLKHDLAILHLDESFGLAPHIIPVCLPYNLHTYSNLRCYASGWGKDSPVGTFQNILKRVDLNIFDSNRCQSALQTTRLGTAFRLHESFVCAGGDEGVDTCKGDGGSPLICSTQPSGGPYFQLGIVAWGIGCGEKGIPGVYADVAKHVSWINHVVQSHYLCEQKKHWHIGSVC